MGAVEDLSRVGHAATALWARTDLRPADVDVAQLYDGFTIEVAWWLEALGFCGAGEAGAFEVEGDRIGIGGELPLNTWGAALGRPPARRLRAHRRGRAAAAGRGGGAPGPGRRGGGRVERGRLRGRCRPVTRY